MDINQQVNILKCKLYIEFIPYIYIYIGSISYTNSYFGNGPGPHIISDFYCNNDDKSLLDCTYHSDSFIDAAWHCGDGDAVGVVCGGT